VGFPETTNTLPRMCSAGHRLSVAETEAKPQGTRLFTPQVGIHHVAEPRNHPLPEAQVKNRKPQKESGFAGLRVSSTYSRWLQQNLARGWAIVGYRPSRRAKPKSPASRTIATHPPSPCFHELRAWRRNLGVFARGYALNVNAGFA